MTDDLGFESRLLVDAARAGLGPDEIAVRRMRARIASAVAGGAVGIGAAHAANAAATSSAASGAAVAGGAATSAIATKLVVAAIGIAIAAGTGAGVYAVAARNPAPAPIASAASHRDATPAPAAHAPAAVPVMPAPIAPAVLSEPPADSQADAIHSMPAHAVAPHVATPAPAPRLAPPPPSLARETQLLGDAQSALSAGRLADAIAAVAHYDAETAGRGQLAEDAAAIDVEARCKLRDPSAGEALDVFTVRWPRSHESARLAAECSR